MTPQERQEKLEKLERLKKLQRLYELQNMQGNYIPADVEPETGKGEALLRGAAQGASFGFADELTAALGAAGRFVGLGDESKGFGEDYSEIVGESREAYKKASEDQPGTFLAGEIAGGAVIPGGIALRAGKGALAVAKSAAKIGAAEGATTGIGMSTGES